MKLHIILGVLFVMALLAPSTRSAPAAADEAEDLAAAEAQAADAEEPLEAVEDEADDSGSVETADPKLEISNDYYIDVKDHVRPPPPWWF